MRKYVFMFILALVPLLSAAQDSRPFDCMVSNDEYKIFIKMDLYDKDVDVPGQDLLGKVEGYIASRQSTHKWIIVLSEIKSDTEAELEVINDYGSEDFKAVLTLEPDGTYSFKRKGGSTMKFGVRGKWQKIPASIKFKK